MSKNKINMGVIKGNPIALVAKSLDKHGRIKGVSKKERKALKAICFHHAFNKKGNLKPTIYTTADDRDSIVCSMCAAKILQALPNEFEIAAGTGEIKAMVEQSKFIAASTGASPETIQYLATFATLLSGFPKVYEDLIDIAKKQDMAKHKRKNGNSFSGGSSDFGTWNQK